MITGKGRERLSTDEALTKALEEISSWPVFAESLKPAIYIWSEMSAAEKQSPEL